MLPADTQLNAAVIKPHIMFETTSRILSETVWSINVNMSRFWQQRLCVFQVERGTWVLRVQQALGGLWVQMETEEIWAFRGAEDQWEGKVRPIFMLLCWRRTSVFHCHIQTVANVPMTIQPWDLICPKLFTTSLLVIDVTWPKNTFPHCLTIDVSKHSLALSHFYCYFFHILYWLELFYVLYIFMLHCWSSGSERWDPPQDLSQALRKCAGCWSKCW